MQAVGAYTAALKENDLIEGSSGQVGQHKSVVQTTSRDRFSRDCNMQTHRQTTLRATWPASGTMCGQCGPIFTDSETTEAVLGFAICVAVSRMKNKAIIDGRLCPTCTTHNVYSLIFVVEQNLIGIDAVVSAVPLLPLMNTHDEP